MRETLAKLEGRRIAVTATFSRFGEKKAFKGRRPLVTILLVNLKGEQGNELCDHLWLTEGKQFKGLCLKSGEQVAFEATVTQYTKGYKGPSDPWDDKPPVSTDYRLSRPTKVRQLGAPSVSSVKSDQLQLF